MAFTGYVAHRITPRVTHIACEAGVFVTLITGEKSTILLDTAFGAGDLPGLVAGLTSLDYIVINSHYHQDHAWGNSSFAETFMHPGDIPIFRQTNTPELRGVSYGERGFLVREGIMNESEFEAWTRRTPPPVKPIEDGERFDLGGLHVRVVHLPGHTEGCIGLLLEEERLLLSGDTVSKDVWMGLPGCAGMDTLADSLQRVLGLPVGRCVGSHYAEPMSMDVVRAELYHCEHFPAVEGEKIRALGEENLRYSCETPFGRSCVTVFGAAQA